MSESSGWIIASQLVKLQIVTHNSLHRYISVLLWNLDGGWVILVSAVESPRISFVMPSCSPAWSLSRFVTFPWSKSKNSESKVKLTSTRRTPGPYIEVESFFENSLSFDP